jgi:hypothetical protein
MKLLLSIKSVRSLVTEVLFYDKDLDNCLFEALLNEGFNLSALASRALGQGKSLIRHELDGDEFVMVISKSDDTLKVTAAAIGEPVEGGWWRLKYLYSDELSSTMLALLGALSLYKRVLPDLDVSQAAEKLIKTYFDKSKDDTSLIQLDADKIRKEEQRDQGPGREHLRAGYLSPPGSESVVGSAVSSGEKLVKDFSAENDVKPNDVKEDLAKIAIEGFTEAYAKPEKTGSEQIPADINDKIFNALKKGDFKEATKLLSDSYKKKSSSKKTWIVTWLRNNEGQIVDHVKNFLENPKSGSGLGDFDTFISDLVEKEMGHPGYSIVDAAM